MPTYIANSFFHVQPTMSLSSQMSANLQAWIFILSEEGKLDIVRLSDAPEDYAAFPRQVILNRNLTAWSIFGCDRALVSSDRPYDGRGFLWLFQFYIPLSV